MNDRPLLGGFLEHPASKFPSFSTQFWKEYPYLLPCIGAASVGVLGFITTLLFVEDVSFMIPLKSAVKLNYLDVYRAGLQNIKSSPQIRMVPSNPRLDHHAPRVQSSVKQMNTNRSSSPPRSF